MIPIIEFQERSLTGPVMKGEESDMEFSMKVRELVKKHDIKDNPEELVVDDATADKVFKAGVDLLAEVGVFHMDTERVVQFNKEEIEAGFFNNRISRTVIETYLNDPVLKNIQALILACTHYPLIKPQIDEFYQGGTRVFDSTDFISKEVGTILDKMRLHNESKSMRNHFYVSDLTESFEKTTRLFFKDEIVLEFYPLWESTKNLFA